MTTRAVHPIEQRSYEILRSLVDTSVRPPYTRAVVERVVHASADLDYAAEIVADEAALALAAERLREGVPVVTDVAMVAAGITARRTVCRVADPEAARLARELGITRSAAGLRLAAEEVGPGAVYVIGCAPTALFELITLAGRAVEEHTPAAPMLGGHVSAAPALAEHGRETPARPGRAVDGHAPTGHVPQGHAGAGHALDGNAHAGRALEGHGGAGHTFDGQTSAGNALDRNARAGNALDGRTRDGNARAGHASAENAQAGRALDVNAPTGHALEGHARTGPTAAGRAQVAPTLVIGLPVGFVGAVESKAALRDSGLPAVTNTSAKGGSAVAAAALNALLYT
jgi:precorrin-8X/cobalt-precorrin-8 methylmutase